MIICAWLWQFFTNIGQTIKIFDVHAVAWRVAKRWTISSFIICQYLGTKSSVKCFNWFVRKNNHCLGQETSVSIICSTFPVFTVIYIFIVLWVFFYQQTSHVSCAPSLVLALRIAAPSSVQQCTEFCATLSEGIWLVGGKFPYWLTY